jgi:cytochrome c oxidase subunit 2
LDAWYVSAFFFLLGIAIVTYGGRDWMPPLASRHGAGIDAMLRYLLVTTGLMLLIAFSVLAWFILQGGRRETVTRRLASRRAELLFPLALGVLMALVAEGGVLAIGLPVWNEYFEAAPPPNALAIDVTGQQFLWLVRYPGPDGAFGRVETRLVDDVANPTGLDRTDPAAADDVTLINQIVAVVDRPLRVRLHARDMIHSFFLPHLRVKQDAIPGMTPEITFVPTREGVFELACAELCGLGHYRMQGQLRVVGPEQFDEALREEAAK